MRSDWPRYIDDRRGYNLREVHKNLYVAGLRGAYALPPPRGGWGASVNLCSRQDGQPWGEAHPHLGWHFPDGQAFPRGLLQAALEITRSTLDEGRPVLLFCAAGASRSASVAYAVLRIRGGLSHDSALSRVRTAWDTSRNFPVPETLKSAREWLPPTSVPLPRWCATCRDTGFIRYSDDERNCPDCG